MHYLLTQTFTETEWEKEFDEVKILRKADHCGTGPA